MADVGILDLSLSRTTESVAPKISTQEAVPFWGSNPDAWDTVIINGRTRLPGLAKLSGSIKRQVDKKKPAGRHGTSVTYLGTEAAEFEIKLSLWTAEHLSAFTSMIRAIMSKQPEKLGATTQNKTLIKAPIIDVYHPLLAIYGVTRMHVLSQKMPEMTEPGVYEASLECLEYLPPEKSKAQKVNTPNGVTGGSAGAGNLTDLKAVYNPPAVVPVKPSQTNAGPT